jgi:hypothetical protein
VPPLPTLFDRRNNIFFVHASKRIEVMKALA